MRSMPVMLNLVGRRVVVVGAGQVGVRRAQTAIDAGATVVVVEPQKDVATNLPQGVSLLREPYRADLLAGSAVVFACTGDRKLNARIVRDARKAGALANAADQPEDCDFFMPAVAYDGDVVLAVGTGGAAPALARRLARQLAKTMPTRIGEFAAAIEQARTLLKDRLAEPHRRMTLMKALCDESAYREFLANGPSAVMSRLESLLKKS